MRKLSGRSARLRAGRFVVEGPQGVREALAAHAASVGSGTPLVHDLFATSDAARRHPELIAAADGSGVRVRETGDEVLAAMSDTVTPQGLLAVCSLVDVPLDTVLARRPLLVAVLASVRDPGNAGTVLRAADAAGADAVVLTEASVDVHNPKCVRSTAGSLFHLPVVVGAPLGDAVAALRSAGLTVLAADGEGDADLDELLDAAGRDDGDGGGLAGPVAWVFGNEAWGLPAEHLALADAVVRVPVHGRAESLNLATAATVCLYASARAQRRGHGCRV
ncbi:MAG: RNA methyltransferase [Actinomycetales bacterium]|nr:RNA methyltransferase [Actinomycetales bacterium]